MASGRLIAGEHIAMGRSLVPTTCMFFFVAANALIDCTIIGCSFQPPSESRSGTCARRSSFAVLRMFPSRTVRYSLLGSGCGMLGPAHLPSQPGFSLAYRDTPPYLLGSAAHLLPTCTITSLHNDDCHYITTSDWNRSYRKLAAILAIGRSLQY